MAYFQSEIQDTLVLNDEVKEKFQKEQEAMEESLQVRAFNIMTMLTKMTCLEN